MKTILIDTDVLSFLFKNDSRAEVYEPHLTGAAQLISFMTLAELELWAAWRKWGKRKREALDAYLRRYTVVFPVYICRALKRDRSFYAGSLNCSSIS